MVVMATVYSVPQNFSTTLNVGGGINNSQTSGIVLTSVTGLPTDGGILCFDWANPLDTDTAEYIEYTGISGNTLTGVTRGAEGLSAKSHNNACVVAGVISQAHIKRLKEKIDGTDTTGIASKQITDTSGNEQIIFTKTSSAVNEITVTNAATGGAPEVSATGGDTNIDLALKGKGSGRVKAYDGSVSSGVLTQSGQQIYAADAGASDSYAITLSPVPAAYYTGMVINFKANTANTGAATLNVNSLGAKTIKKNNDQDLANNDIESGQIVTVVYDGTNFQMQSQIANTSSSNSWASHTTTWSGFSADPTGTFRYVQVGNVMYVNFTASGNGTSNSTSLTATLPAAAAQSQKIHCIGRAVDNSSTQTTPAMVSLSSASATATFYKDQGESSWTNTGSKSINFQFFYEV